MHLSKKSIRILLIIASMLTIIFCLAGIVGQNLSFDSYISDNESYADNFTSLLLVSPILFSVSTLAVRFNILSYFISAAALSVLIYKAPWQYGGINTGYIENPWSSPAILALIIFSLLVNMYSYFQNAKNKT